MAVPLTAAVKHEHRTITVVRRRERRRRSVRDVVPDVMEFGGRQAGQCRAEEFTGLPGVNVAEAIPRVIDAKILWWQPKFGVKRICDGVHVLRAQACLLEAPASR